MPRLSSCTLALGLALLACTSTGGGGASPARSANVLTRDELASVPELSAYDAVRRLRPAWLQTRGPTTIERTELTGLRIYVDGAPRGDVEELRLLRASDIETMRFLSAREATTRYGTDHADGAVLVSMRKG